METKKRSLREKVKLLFSPIRYAKKWYWIFLGTEIYDWFQSIFTVQISAWIIWAIEKGDIHQVKYYITLFIIISCITYILRWLGEISRDPLDKILNFNLQKEYLWKYIHLDNTKVEAFWTGKMSNIIFEWIGNRSNILSRTLPAIIVECIAIIYAFTLVASKTPNTLYFFIFLWLFLLNAILILIGLHVLQTTRKKSKEIYMEISRKQVKILMSKFEILQNNKFEQEMKPIASLTKQITTLWIKGNTKKSIWHIWSNMILDGIQVSIYLIIWIGIITWNYSFAYLMLLIQLLWIMSKYIWNIRNHLKEYYKWITHVDKLLDTFDSIPTHKEKPDAKIFIPKSESIELKNISFAYSSTSKVFTNFSLMLAWWKKTAFVGPSGWGKTTLIKLIAWYIRPDKWEVIVDGQTLGDISFKSYYKKIWYLTQDPSIFDGTIYENLTHAIDDSETKTKWFMTHLKKIISLAKCEFVLKFKDWLETEIGERGVRLSWWQKQRLAIAKIMLKDPEIVLWTSHIWSITKSFQRKNCYCSRP